MGLFVASPSFLSFFFLSISIPFLSFLLFLFFLPLDLNLSNDGRLCYWKIMTIEMEWNGGSVKEERKEVESEMM